MRRASHIIGTGSGTPATATSETRACTKQVARWALGDPVWPQTAVAFGGKFGIDDDTETPNTLTAGFNYGNQQQLVVEVRGRMTNGEGVRQNRVVMAGPNAAPRPGAAAPPAPT